MVIPPCSVIIRYSTFCFVNFDKENQANLIMFKTKIERWINYVLFPRNFLYSVIRNPSIQGLDLIPAFVPRTGSTTSTARIGVATTTTTTAACHRRPACPPPWISRSAWSSLLKAAPPPYFPAGLSCRPAHPPPSGSSPAWRRPVTGRTVITGPWPVPTPTTPATTATLNTTVPTPAIQTL